MVGHFATVTRSSDSGIVIRMLAVGEVAEVLNRSHFTSWAACTRRGLPAIKVGYGLWVRPEDLVKWLKGRGARYFGRAVMGDWSVADARRDDGKPYRCWPKVMRLTTVVEVAGVPGWNTRTVRRLIRQGRLPGHLSQGENHGVWQVRREDLREFLRPRVHKVRQRGPGALPKPVPVKGRGRGVFDGVPCVDGGWAQRRARLEGGAAGARGEAKQDGGGGARGVPLTERVRARNPPKP